MKIINGTFDGQKIIPDEPITAPPNTRVRVVFEEEAPSRRRYTLDDFFKLPKYQGLPKSLEEMDEGIRKGA